MAATVRDGKQDQHVSGTPFDLAATRTAKPKARVPEILVGTFLVALFALAGAWFYSTSTQTRSYVALRENVTRGQVISEDQLTVHELNTEAPILGIPGGEFGSVVGKVALADMRIGTLVTQHQFAEKAKIPAGFGIVGLDLAPGEYPTLSLRPGDRVRVIVLPRGGDTLPSQAVQVIDDDVEVLEVVDGGGRDRFISLTLSADLADQVATADSEDRVRLIQVAGE